MTSHCEDKFHVMWASLISQLCIPPHAAILLPSWESVPLPLPCHSWALLSLPGCWASTHGVQFRLLSIHLKWPPSSHVTCLQGHPRFISAVTSWLCDMKNSYSRTALATASPAQTARPIKGRGLSCSPQTFQNLHRDRGTNMWGAYFSDSIRASYMFRDTVENGHLKKTTLTLSEKPCCYYSIFSV